MREHIHRPNSPPVASLIHLILPASSTSYHQPYPPHITSLMHLISPAYSP